MTVESVLATFKVNVSNAIKILIEAIPKIVSKDWTEIIAQQQVSNTIIVIIIIIIIIICHNPN